MNKNITAENMQYVYNELKTPFKYGMVVTSTDEGIVDVDPLCRIRHNGSKSTSRI